jgi:hypothetical protein
MILVHVSRRTVRRACAAAFAAGLLAASSATFAGDSVNVDPANGAAASAGAAGVGTVVPAGTRLRFHLDEPLSSDGSKTGQHFGFTMLDPVMVDGATVVPANAHGDGTVVLAGRAGTSGHEGDLTLRLDGIAAPNGNRLTPDDEQVEINGTNHKVASAVLGFVPWVGLGAIFIHGHQIRIGTDTPVLVVTRNSAMVTSQVEAAAPAAAESPALKP